jgi:hypothetical protein
MCPHTTIYVPSYCYICSSSEPCLLPTRSPGKCYFIFIHFFCFCFYNAVRASRVCGLRLPPGQAVRGPRYTLILLYMCSHTAIYVSLSCYMCLHTGMYVSSYCYVMCPHTAMYVSSYCYICVLILLYMCPHTTIHVSSYCCMCPHTPFYMSSYCCMCPHTDLYMSSYCFIHVLILLYTCPHTSTRSTRPSLVHTYRV